jgi:hypothetical protein
MTNRFWLEKMVCKWRNKRSEQHSPITPNEAPFVDSLSPKWEVADHSYPLSKLPKNKKTNASLRRIGWKLDKTHGMWGFILRPGLITNLWHHHLSAAKQLWNKDGNHFLSSARPHLQIHLMFKSFTDRVAQLAWGHCNHSSNASYIWRLVLEYLPTQALTSIFFCNNPSF